DHLVNVHVRGTAGDPNKGIGNVLTGERLNSFVHFFRPRSVPLEAHDRELRLRHTRIDGADAHTGAAEFKAQSASDLKLARFGRAIRRPAFIRHAASDRTDIDDDGTRI